MRGIHCHYTGAAAEMAVASHYLENGWDVFLPVITQAKADMVISKGGETYKLQVKKLTENPSSGHIYLQTRLQGKQGKYSKRDYEEEDFQYLVCYHKGSIWEIPYPLVSDLTSLTIGKLLPDGTVTRKKGDWNPIDFKIK